MALYISASTIQSYIECPKSVFYRLNYPEASLQTPEMEIGTLVHSVIEKYWNDRETAFRTINKYCETAPLPENIKNRARVSIATFFNIFRSLVSDTDDVEPYFKIPMPVYSLVGRMDRVTKDGLVIDWKTSPRPPTNINSSIQFIIYHYAYKRLYGKPPTAVMYASLTTGQSLVLKHDKVMEYGIINSVLPNIVRAIETDNLPTLGLYNGRCKHCQFSKICHEELGYVVDSSEPSYVKTQA